MISQGLSTLTWNLKIILQGIQSKVYGTIILLQEEDLAKFFKIRPKGIHVTDVHGEIERLNDNYSYHTCVTRVLGEDNITLGLDVIIDRLDIDTHLLLYIANEILLCKDGNNHTTSDAKLFLI